jgi:hypothetical protein
MRLVVAAAAMSMLAGCATAAQLRQTDESQCTGYGFRPGTVAYANCLQQESLARRYGWWPGWPQAYPWW